MNGGQTPFIDAHCHIDLYDRPQEIVAEAEHGHIYTIAVTNAPSVFAHTENLCAMTKYVRPALGLHPELVSTHAGEIDLFRSILSRTKYVGEIGLDYTTPDEKVRQLQRSVFSSVVACVNEHADKILTVHSRRAARDVIACLQGIKAKVILHWFSGTKKDADRAALAGFYFSINLAMLRSDRGRALVMGIPKEQLLTETDGPFVQHGTEQASPAHIAHTILGLADLWAEPPEQVQARVFQTFRRLLGI
jgi:TatD DNase family protein